MSSSFNNNSDQKPNQNKVGSLKNRRAKRPEDSFMDMFDIQELPQNQSNLPATDPAKVGAENNFMGATFNPSTQQPQTFEIDPNLPLNTPNHFGSQGSRQTDSAFDQKFVPIQGRNQELTNNDLFEVGLPNTSEPLQDPRFANINDFTLNPNKQVPEQKHEDIFASAQPQFNTDQSQYYNNGLNQPNNAVDLNLPPSLKAQSSNNESTFDLFKEIFDGFSNNKDKNNGSKVFRVDAPYLPQENIVKEKPQVTFDQDGKVQYESSPWAVKEEITPKRKINISQEDIDKRAYEVWGDRSQDSNDHANKFNVKLPNRANEQPLPSQAYSQPQTMRDSMRFNQESMPKPVPPKKIEQEDLIYPGTYDLKMHSQHIKQVNQDPNKENQELMPLKNATAPSTIINGYAFDSKSMNQQELNTNLQNASREGLIQDHINRQNAIANGNDQFIKNKFKKLNEEKLSSQGNINTNIIASPQYRKNQEQKMQDFEYGSNFNAMDAQGSKPVSLQETILANHGLIAHANMTPEEINQSIEQKLGQSITGAPLRSSQNRSSPNSINKIEVQNPIYDRAKNGEVSTIISKGQPIVKNQTPQGVQDRFKDLRSISSNSAIIGKIPERKSVSTSHLPSTITINNKGQTPNNLQGEKTPSSLYENSDFRSHHTATIVSNSQGRIKVDDFGKITPDNNNKTSDSSFTSFNFGKTNDNTLNTESSVITGITTNNAKPESQIKNEYTVATKTKEEVSSVDLTQLGLNDPLMGSFDIDTNLDSKHIKKEASKSKSNKGQANKDLSKIGDDLKNLSIALELPDSDILEDSPNKAKVVDQDSIFKKEQSFFDRVNNNTFNFSALEAHKDKKAKEKAPIPLTEDKSIEEILNAPVVNMKEGSTPQEAFHNLLKEADSVLASLKKDYNNSKSEEEKKKDKIADEVDAMLKKHEQIKAMERQQATAKSDIPDDHKNTEVKSVFAQDSNTFGGLDNYSMPLVTPKGDAKSQPLPESLATGLSSINTDANVSEDDFKKYRTSLDDIKLNLDHAPQSGEIDLNNKSESVAPKFNADLLKDAITSKVLSANLNPESDVNSTLNMPNVASLSGEQNLAFNQAKDNIEVTQSVEQNNNMTQEQRVQYIAMLLQQLLQMYQNNNAQGVEKIFQILNSLGINAQSAFQQLSYMINSQAQVQQAQALQAQPIQQTAQQGQDDTKANNKLESYLDSCHNYVNYTNYFLQRGISQQVVDRFKLGFDPNFKLNGSFNTAPVAIIPLGNQSFLARHTQMIDGNRMYRYGNQCCFNLGCLNDIKNQVIFITSGEFDALSLETLGCCSIALGSNENAKELLTYLQKVPPVKRIFFLCLKHGGQWETSRLILNQGLKALGYIYTEANLCSPYSDINEALLKNKQDFISRLSQCVSVAQYQINKSATTNYVDLFKNFSQDKLKDQSPMPTMIKTNDLGANNSVANTNLSNANQGLITSLDDLLNLRISNNLYTINCRSIPLMRLILSRIVQSRHLPIIYVASAAQGDILADIIFSQSEALKQYLNSFQKLEILEEKLWFKILELPNQQDLQAFQNLLSTNIANTRVKYQSNCILMVDACAYDVNFSAHVASLLSNVATKVNQPTIVWCEENQKNIFESMSIQSLQIDQLNQGEFVINTFDRSYNPITFRCFL